MAGTFIVDEGPTGFSLALSVPADLEPLQNLPRVRDILQ